VLKLSDPEFLGKGESKLNGFPSVLEGHEDSFLENQRAVVSGITEAVQGRLLCQQERIIVGVRRTLR
jgi:hypothetical protein